MEVKKIRPVRFLPEEWPFGKMLVTIETVEYRSSDGVRADRWNLVVRMDNRVPLAFTVFDPGKFAAVWGLDEESWIDRRVRISTRSYMTASGETRWVFDFVPVA